MNEVLWLVGRGTGMASLALLTVSVVLGVFTATRWVHREVPRFAVTEVHRRASLGAAVLLVVHVLTLLLDTEAGLSVLDVLVPFANSSNRLWYGLGTVGLELFAVTAVTGLLRKRMSYRVFRGLHLLAYLCWPVALAHGIGSGSDVGEAWFWGLTGLCVLGTAATLFYRLDSLDRQPAAPARPARTKVGV